MIKHRQMRRRPEGMAGRYDSNIHLKPFYIECRVCAFEPSDQFSLPCCACPKCHSHAWQRVLRPGSLLAAGMSRADTPLLKSNGPEALSLRASGPVRQTAWT